MSLFETFNLINVLQRKGLIKSLPSDIIDDDNEQGPLRLLSSRGLINEREAIDIINAELGSRFIDLENELVQRKLRIQDLVENLNPAFCWSRKALPLFEEEELVIVGCVNPLDYTTKRYLELRFEKPVELVICEEKKLEHLLEQYLSRSKIEIDNSGYAESASIELCSAIKQEQNLDRVQPDAPLVVKLVNKIIAEAVKLKASDIHLDTEATGISVRFRIDGILHPAFKIPRQHQLAVTSRIKLLAGMDIVEKRRPQDGRLTATSGQQRMDIRASCLPTAYGEKLVMRLLPANGEETTLSALGFPIKIEEALKEVLSQRGKILLITGPTGSGKTTTLYASLNHIKDGTTSIQTVEDPIEIKIRDVSQVQVNLGAGVTFASALRSILRQDPDIIMVGEIRDAETADIAMQASQTGHLVLSSLHTNNAPSAITRLINLDCKPYIIATSLAGILAQRLVRRVCPECKKEVAREDLLPYRALLKHFRLNETPLFIGRGCPNCNGTGYKGRTVVLSYLNINEDIADLITASAPISEIVACALNDGFVSLEDSALDLLKRGETSLEEVKGLLFAALTSKGLGHIHEPVSTSTVVPLRPIVEPKLSAIEKTITKETLDCLPDSKNIFDRLKVKTNLPEAIQRFICFY